MSQLNPLDALAYRSLGFALSVQDLCQVNNPMSREQLIKALTDYANQYHTIREPKNEATK